MKDQMHMAAQYLAAAGISFVAKKEDDSHTNLGFDIDATRMTTHPLSAKGDRLALNYTSFSLEWLSPQKTSHFPLDGKTHREVLNWLHEISNSMLRKTYTYDLHYDLPYDINDQEQFKLTDAADLQVLCDLRTLAQHTLERIIDNNNLVSEIRVWPHHFDTGIFTTLEKGSDISIGLGLAIPDQVSDAHYFYLSAYQNGTLVNPSSFESLALGKWVSNGFKGAVFPATNIAEFESVQFFQELIDYFKK